MSSLNPHLLVYSHRARGDIPEEPQTLRFQGRGNYPYLHKSLEKLLPGRSGVGSHLLLSPSAFPSHPTTLWQYNTCPPSAHAQGRPGCIEGLAAMSRGQYGTLAFAEMGSPWGRSGWGEGSKGLQGALARGGQGGLSSVSREASPLRVDGATAACVHACLNVCTVCSACTPHGSTLHYFSGLLSSGSLSSPAQLQGSRFAYYVCAWLAAHSDWAPFPQCTDVPVSKGPWGISAITRSGPEKTPFPQSPKGRGDKWLSMAPVSISKCILPSRLLQCHKYLTHTSESMLAS